MKYTEEDLRKAFQNGIVRGEFLERDEYAPFFKPFDEDEYIDSLKGSVIEETEFLDMQYYMEFCQANGYITPKEWILNHKHY